MPDAHELTLPPALVAALVEAGGLSITLGRPGAGELVELRAELADLAATARELRRLLRETDARAMDALTLGGQARDLLRRCNHSPEGAEYTCSLQRAQGAAGQCAAADCPWRSGAGG